MSKEVKGPRAPKDPTKKRSGFYIMRNKDISASPKDDGTGVCYIYENDGRMISSARLVGAITDEDMLNLMTTTAGFRKLVHSIGVSIQTPDRDSIVRFVLQMYGHADVYNSGTNIIADVQGNGMENIIELDSIDWSDDDNEPGQIRFEFEKAGMSAQVSVCYYLNDGYTAPEPEDEHPVDVNSDAYQEMITWSLMNQGNNYRLKKAIDKAMRKEDTTIAFIGGSITQGAGAVPINTQCYARKIYEGFCEMTGCNPDENVHYIKAGVGGTPSELGMLRYKKDILDEGTPDIVVIEFAVNDEGDETKGECYDSLVRMAYDGPGHPAVILLFAVFADDMNLQERLSPVGYGYDIPMVSVKNSVTEQFYKSYEEGRLVSKNQFFYDRYHPSNIGHKIMADGVLYMMKQAMKAPLDEEVASLRDKDCIIGSDFADVIRVDRAQNPVNAIIDCGSFTATDTDIQYVERNMDPHGTPQFTDNWMHAMDAADKPFTLETDAKIILLIFKDSADNRTGKADVYVDGEKTYYADPREIGWTHCNAAIVYRSNTTAHHTVEIRMAQGSADKEFTILGFGIVQKLLQL